MDNLQELFQQIIDKPIPSLSIILNLVLIESLLSVDNAAVLATMVMDLPKDQRKKALKYGIVGAYIFRGICLFFAVLLVQVWWFKPVGGIYLLFLTGKYFFQKQEEESPETIADELNRKKKSALYHKTIGAFGPFWSTVILVELMDLAFSIDNVIAATAYTKNIILIWAGVFIGILAMRFVAQGFVRLMEKYPFLNACAYTVIGILGAKLTMSVLTHFYPCTPFTNFLEGPQACLDMEGGQMPVGEHAIVWGDVLMSFISIGIFVIPVMTSILFNFPKHRQHQG
ncbi:MAG: TerC family protein [Chitinophagaceae bacterium]|nr:TerC family protein [Chitinophagaceae bacterium]MCB9044572.1 TerC family protein [Chitinophagales bacterium]